SGRRRRGHLAGRTAAGGHDHGRRSGRGASSSLGPDGRGAAVAAPAAPGRRRAGRRGQARRAARPVRGGAAQAARAVGGARLPHRYRNPARTRTGVRPQGRVLSRRAQASWTGLVSVPIFSIVTDTSLPATMGPTPAGVPV